MFDEGYVSAPQQGGLANRGAVFAEQCHFVCIQGVVLGTHGIDLSSQFVVLAAQGAVLGVLGQRGCFWGESNWILSIPWIPYGIIALILWNSRFHAVLYLGNGCRPQFMTN